MDVSPVYIDKVADSKSRDFFSTSFGEFSALCLSLKIMVSNTRTPLPRASFTSILIITLTEPLCLSIFFPYLFYLVQDYQIAQNHDQVGFYAGILAACFPFAQFVTSLFWGRASDHFGRKPILLIGLFGNVLSMFAFGFCRNFWLACGIRLITGAVNGNPVGKVGARSLVGNMGVVKSVIAEITDDTNAAFAYGWFNLIWSLGSICGPLIGGLLNRPVQNFPTFFARSIFLKENPYFLPPFVSSVYCLIGFFVCLWGFEETGYRGLSQQADEAVDVPSRHSRETSKTIQFGYESFKPECQYVSSLIEELSRPNSPIRQQAWDPETTDHCQRTSRYAVLTIGCYVCLAFSNAIVDEIYNIWILEPPKRGGLGFSPSEIGISLSVLGVLDVLFQVTLYNQLQRLFGSVRLFCCSIGINSISIAVLSFLGEIPLALGYADCGVSTPGHGEELGGCFDRMENSTKYMIWSALLVVMTIKVTSQLCCYATILVLISNSATSGSIGTVNGTSQSGAALMRAVAPLLGGAMWSWSLGAGLQFPFDFHFCFIIASVFGLMTTVLASRLPSKLNSRTWS